VEGISCGGVKTNVFMDVSYTWTLPPHILILVDEVLQ